MKYLDKSTKIGRYT